MPPEAGDSAVTPLDAFDPTFVERVRGHLTLLYPDHDVDALAARCFDAVGVEADRPGPAPGSRRLWDHTDALLITYGDTLREPERPPLRTLNDFVADHLDGAITAVHVLPFTPYSSDDGFSVIDYLAVRPELGTWDDLRSIATDTGLMADLVLNHASAQSAWFEQFRGGEAPGRDYFVTASPDDDLSAVVRSRTHPLLQEVETPDGPRHVWCTFSHDQVDLDFANPDVLLEFLEIIDAYVEHGVRFLRLDAVAFVWKRIGTTCLHLPETHELVRLLHTLLRWRAPWVGIVTETNVPNVENLTYFGNRNEAHLIYNFSLPPLLLDALHHGRSDRLSAWTMSMPPAPEGCAYFNFIGSHDGIGLRPAEGLLTDAEIDELVAVAVERGGLASPYLRDGAERPYELNLAPIDAFGGPAQFLCAHTIMLGLEGVPGMWIHSLLSTPSDVEAVERTGVARAINRSSLPYGPVTEELEAGMTDRARVFAGLVRRLRLRAGQPAFHPNATQFTLQLGDELFGLWRQSRDRSQSVFAIHNLTGREVTFPTTRINLIGTEDWYDLIGGAEVPAGATLTIAPHDCLWITNRVL